MTLDTVHYHRGSASELCLLKRPWLDTLLLYVAPHAVQQLCAVSHIQPGFSMSMACFASRMATTSILWVSTAAGCVYLNHDSAA